MQNMLSGIVITYNEEKHIGDCVKSLMAVCDEVIVLDSLSTDNTVEIASSLGARVESQPFLGDGPQKIIAGQLARYDWLVLLDADEQLSETAQSSIKSLNLSQTDPTQCFSLERINHIGHRQIKHAWGNDRLIRLYNKREKNVLPVLDHTRVVDHGSTKASNIYKLKGSIIHYGFTDYTNLAAKSLRLADRASSQKKTMSPLSPIAHALNAFVRIYIFKAGLLDGIDGLTIAINVSYFTYLKYARAYERQKYKTNEIG